MAMQAARRLDKIEQAILRKEGPAPIKLTRLFGQGTKQTEREYIFTQARAALGLCEPDNTIFVSRRVKKLKDEYPGFPHRMIREDAEQLIKEYEK